MVTARNEKPPLPLSKIKDPLYPELLQVGVFLLLRELLTFHTIMNTTSHTRVSRGTKRLLVFFGFFTAWRERRRGEQARVKYSDYSSDACFSTSEGWTPKWAR